MGQNLSINNDFELIIEGALIFTVSFMWKDLLSDIEEAYFPKDKGLFFRIIFVLFITILLLYLVFQMRLLFRSTPTSRQIYFVSSEGVVSEGTLVTSEGKIDFDSEPDDSLPFEDEDVEGGD